jgi:hypothetical protein
MDNLSTFASPEIDVADTSGATTYTPTADISTDGVYYWRVRAKNAAGEFGAWSTAGAFTLDTTAPAAPVLSVPADNAAGVRATPTFSWLASVGANAYQFRISDDRGSVPSLISPDGTSAAPGTPLAVLAYKPKTNLELLKNYYWQVRARDAAGNWSDYSAYRTIKVLPTFVGPCAHRSGCQSPDQ